MWQLSQAANANTKFRIIIGFTAGTSNSCTIAIGLINLDTNAVVLNKSVVVNSTVEFASNAFTGGIALYGHYGRTTTVDMLYPIEEDTTLAALLSKYTLTAEA
jgi:hypothetical protein